MRQIGQHHPGRWADVAAVKSLIPLTRSVHRRRYNPRNTRPVCDHLGEAPAGFWHDHQSSKVNSIRTRTLIEKADMVVVRFGDQYKQWNAAFDAGYCAALNKPYITLHSEDIVHPLKEVDAAAQVWCTTTDQVVEILRYVLKV